MPRGRCDGCGRIRTVTEISIERKHSPKTNGRTMLGRSRVGQCCADCWAGNGDSWPVIYWP